MTRLRDLVRFEPKRGMELPRWLDRIISAGITSKNPQVIRHQKITNVASYAGAFNAISRLGASLFYSIDDTLLSQAASAFFAITGLLIHRLHRFGDNLGAAALIVWFLGSVSTAAFLYGLQSQIQVYFALAGVMLFLFGVENWRLFLFWFAVQFTVMLLLLNFAPLQGPLLIGNDRALNLLAVQSMFNAITINSVLIFYTLLVLRRAEHDLKRQSDRAEALVGIVLPEQIAERLRSGKEMMIADRIEGASVLFADLVGFTEAAHLESPETVVRYLDEFVRVFDAICELQRVEKIKTIGDSYMAVGGLQGNADEGVEAIGRVALAMIKLQDERPPIGGHKLSLRVGIHYGSAVAGVIGDTRISYDLWGDAINVASRMESHGVPGRIQVSEEYRAAAGQRFLFEERGDTEIKGIGVARTFFLLGPRLKD
jgi:adenylate cyclase